ncbi:hypothetical protein [Streptomyces sp. NRRL S-378]|uniref:hypothetical protein n=1 Tax=Streptomyces sp. NRRL S-378 TaxID=1463904 RepID=UPI0004CB268E|nr:hypothetical protein [Streptomyces sp. NRRL S-378]
MSFDDQLDVPAPNAPESAPRWRRVTLPVPPVSKLVKDSHLTSRLGTVTGAGLGAWIATGNTQGDVTWATVSIALAAIAADAVRSCRCAG